MKKIWLVLLAFVLVFGMISCSDGGGGGKKPPPPTGELTRVDLGDYNTWGGQPAKQSGWATTGFQWKDDSITPNAWKTVDDKGYNLEDFQKAVYLVLEVAEGQPSGGVQLIWGGNDATTAEGVTDGVGGWNQHANNIFTDSGAAVGSMGATQDGNTIKIELSRALKDYSKYIAETTTALRLIIAYYTGDGLEVLGITAAYLLVSEDEPEPPPPPPPPLEAPVKLKDATYLGNETVIGFAGYDGDLDWELFTDSSYLIFAFKGSNVLTDAGDGINTGGFGGMQVVIQGDKDGYNWNQTNSANWTNFSNDGEAISYVIVELDSLVGYNTASGEAGDKGNVVDGTRAKFVLNSGFAAKFEDENLYLGAWLTDVYMDVASMTAHGTGYYLTDVTGLEEDIPPVSLIDATWLGKYTVGNAIGFGGYDGDFDWDLFTDSKYLIFAFTGSNTLYGATDAPLTGINKNGFGGIQIAVQGDADGYNWNQTGFPGWTNFANDGEEICFIVVKLSGLVGYDTPAGAANDKGNIVDGVKGKFVLNSGFAAQWEGKDLYLGAWITDVDLDVTGMTAYGTDGYLTKVTGLEE
jgi:hypothetical protein